MLWCIILIKKHRNRCSVFTTPVSNLSTSKVGLMCDRSADCDYILRKQQSETTGRFLPSDRFFFGFFSFSRQFLRTDWCDNETVNRWWISISACSGYAVTIHVRAVRRQQGNDEGWQHRRVIDVWSHRARNTTDAAFITTPMIANNAQCPFDPPLLNYTAPIHPTPGSSRQRRSTGWSNKVSHFQLNNKIVLKVWSSSTGWTFFIKFEYRISTRILVVFLFSSFVLPRESEIRFINTCIISWYFWTTVWVCQTPAGFGRETTTPPALIAYRRQRLR